MKLLNKLKRKQKIILLIIIILLFLFSFLFYQYKKIIIPFSLIETQKINFDEYSFNESKDYYDIWLIKSDNIIVSKYIDENYIAIKGNDIENIRNIVTLTRNLLKHDNRNNIKNIDFYNINDVLNKKDDFSAICSWFAKVFSILSEEGWYTSRVLWMHWHVVSESFIPSLNKWIFIDPDKNVFIKSIDGEYLNLWEILNTKQNFTFERITDINNNDYDVIDNIWWNTDWYKKLLLSREKVILLSWNSLLSYPNNAYNYKKVLLAYLWYESLATWIQLDLNNGLNIWNKDIINQIKNLLK